MIERHLDIPTTDGPMPTFVTAPDGVTGCPAIILYMDLFGPREEMFDFCRRFTEAGFVALLPNLFHRLGSPVFPPANVKGEKPHPDAQAANRATTLDHTRTDTRAIVAALDNGLVGPRADGIGVIGYCMGGRHALAAAVAEPDVYAGLSVHGGRLVDDTVDSPHLLIRHLTVPFHFAFAVDDGTCPEDHQALIRREAAASGPHVTCELYQAAHGWSFPERWRYDREASEAIWQRAIDMFRRAPAAPSPAS